MLVPSNRLLIYTGILGIPLFTLLGIQAASPAVIMATAILLLLIVGLDAPSAWAAFRRFKISLPPTLRTTKGRELKLHGIIRHPGTAPGALRIGLSIPKGLFCPKNILSLTLDGKQEAHAVEWELQALERGQYRLHEVYLEGVSRLGLWHGRQTQNVSCEIRVYPDLSRERHVLAPLFFRRGALGLHQVRQIGKGREFEQLREYAPGDGYDDIYWKGTAKRRLPVTKMYQLERTQEVYVVLDCSRRTARSLDLPKLPDTDDQTDTTEITAEPPAKTMLERFIQASLVLALASEQQTDKFGLIVFSDKVQRFIPAGGGRSHYDVIRDVLYTLEPTTVSPDYEDVFIHIGNRLRQRALLLFLTDLGEPWLAESFVEGIPLISRRHVVLTHMLGQREIQPLFAQGDTLESDNTLYQRLAGHLLWQDLEQTTRQLKQCSVHLTTSLQENLVADVVSEYLKVKKRQLI